MMISIIIVNYNTCELLVNCIKSIYLHVSEIDYEIIVVDNDSNDGSQNFIKKHFPDIILIESEINLGFGLANNLGVQYAKGDFLFLLNSDTVLIDNALKKLFYFFISNEIKLNIGVVGAIMVDDDLNVNGFGGHFPTCNEVINFNLSKIPILKYLANTPQSFNYNLKEKYFPIDYVIGADMFLRRDLFLKLNGFYKDFFMYYEESDLQKRISNLGLKCYVVTDVKIIHLEDGSGKAIKRYSNRKRTIMHRSRNIYLKRNDKKHYTKFLIIDLIILLMGFFNFKYSFNENVTYFRQVIKTY